jgi:hypothetical protein
VDTLQGNLGVFGLDAIIGLLAGTRKTGALRVVAGRLLGRVFFVEGAVVYATTRAKDGSVNDLRGRGAELPGRDRRRDGAAAPALALPELLRHQIIDVFVRFLRNPSGEFVFDEGVTTTALPPGRPLTFNASELLVQARERFDEWDEIRDLVPSATTRFRMAPVLPADLFDVTLDARSWTFLGAVGGGAAVEEVAERLSIFEYPAARKMAEFIRRGLLVPVGEGESVEEADDATAAGPEVASEADAPAVWLHMTAAGDAAPGLSNGDGVPENAPGPPSEMEVPGGEPELWAAPGDAPIEEHDTGAAARAEAVDPWALPVEETVEEHEETDPWAAPAADAEASSEELETGEEWHEPSIPHAPAFHIPPLPQLRAPWMRGGPETAPGVPAGDEGNGGEGEGFR